MTDVFIKAAWPKVGQDDLTFGLKAYGVYHRALRRWAAHFGFGFVQTVEAFAALSPNNDYVGNLRSLSAVMEAAARGRPDFTISTYRACGLRAYSYLIGEVSFLDTVKGRKITAFRENILYPDTSRLVTVDGHMGSLWAGHDLTMKEAVPIVNRHYSDIERAISSVARKAKMAPCQAQATLWAYRKRTRAVLWDSQLDLFRGGTRLDAEATPADYPSYSPQETETC